MLGVAAFLGAGTFAALSYPGGSHWNRDAVGFDFTTFWCDLLRPIALNGQDNGTGARAAQLALLALALALGPFFSLAESRLRIVGAGRALLRVCSYAGRIALILVAAGTGRLPPVIHDWSILIGGPLGLVALALVIVWSARESRAIAGLGLGSLALCLWNLGQYAREAVLHTASWPGLPIVQKAATLGMVTFIVLLSYRSARTVRASPRAAKPSASAAKTPSR